MGVGGHHEGGIWKRGRTFTWDRDHYTEGGDVSVRRRSVFFFSIVGKHPNRAQVAVGWAPRGPFNFANYSTI